MKRTCTRPLCALLALLLFLPSCGAGDKDSSVVTITACYEVPNTKERLFTMYSDIVVVTVTKTKEKYICRRGSGGCSFFAKTTRIRKIRIL